MQKDLYERLINFLFGASWGILLFGALFTFKTLLVFGLPVALFSGLLFILFMLMVILLLDALSVHKQKLKELEKQTEILEKIFQKDTK